MCSAIVIGHLQLSEDRNPELTVLVSVCVLAGSTVLAGAIGGACDEAARDEAA